MCSRREGRVAWGPLVIPLPLLSLAEAVAELLDLSEVTYTGDPERMVDRVAVVTGSGGSLMEVAAAPEREPSSPATSAITTPIGRPTLVWLW